MSRSQGAVPLSQRKGAASILLLHATLSVARAFCPVHRRRFVPAYNCGLHCNVIFWTLQLNSVGFSV
jgi:hypothetical protein